MEVTVTTLRQALDLVRPAVPRKSTLPVMLNVRLGDGQVVGGDLESAIVADLPEASEAFLMPLEAVTQLLKYVRGMERLTLKVKRGKLNIAWSDGEATYSTTKPDEYPPLPELQETASADLAGDALIPALKSVLPYTSPEASRPVLHGVTLLFSEEDIQVAAGDGYRMAYQVLPLSFPVGQTIVIPANGVNLILHLWAKTPRTPPPSDALVPILTAKKMVRVALAEGNLLKVGFGNASLITKLVQGNPPDWTKLIPTTEPALLARVLAPEFDRAVRRVRDVARSSDNIVRLEFADSRMTISAKGEDGESKATVDLVTSEGEPNRIALSASYLIGYLSDKESIVTISLTSVSAPLLLEHRASPRVVVMPMTAQW